MRGKVIGILLPSEWYKIGILEFARMTGIQKAIHYHPLNIFIIFQIEDHFFVILRMEDPSGLREILGSTQNEKVEATQKLKHSNIQR